MMPQAEPADDVDGNVEIERTAALLGGPGTFSRRIRNRLEAHDVIRAGLPAAALDHLVRELAFFRIPNQDGLGEVFGISGRSLRRRRDAPPKPLSPEQGGRAWKVAEIFGRAIGVMGTKEAAESWLSSPAIALDQRRPIDLLSTTAGIESVEELLTRLEYGVYT